MRPDPRVATPFQARLLLDVHLWPLLSLLTQQSCTVGEAATSLDISLNRAHYLMAKLLKADIAAVEGERPRAGRAMKVYGIGADWFIPFEVTGAETLDAFLSVQLRPRLEQMLGLSVNVMREHGEGWGYWLERGETLSTLRIGDAAGVATDLFGGPAPLLSSVGTLTLNAGQAMAFKARLLALCREFEEAGDPAGEVYSLALMFVRGAVR